MYQGGKLLNGKLLVKVGDSWMSLKKLVEIEAITKAIFALSGNDMATKEKAAT